MKVSLEIKGARELEKSLRSSSKTLRTEAKAALQSTARLLAREYAAATASPDTAGVGAVSKFQNRIASEIAMVYPSRENHSGVFRLIESIHGREKAKAWYHLMKSQKPRAAADFLRSLNLPTATPNAAQLKQYRTGRKGRVRGGQTPVGIVRTSEQRRFTRGQHRLIDTAKGGWAQAAKAVGKTGRVRRGVSGLNAFGAYNPAAIRQPGLGGALVTVNKIIIWTNVRYAVDALKPSLKVDAENRAQSAFTRSLEEAAKAVAAKVNNTKTA